MSVVRCNKCERYVDTDFDAEHFDECGEKHVPTCCVHGCDRELDGSIILCAEHNGFSEQNKDKSVHVGNIKFMWGDQEIELEADEIESQWERDAISRETPDAE